MTLHTKVGSCEWNMNEGRKLMTTNIFKTGLRLESSLLAGSLKEIFACQNGDVDSKDIFMYFECHILAIQNASIITTLKIKTEVYLY